MEFGLVGVAASFAAAIAAAAAGLPRLLPVRLLLLPQLIVLAAIPAGLASQFRLQQRLGGIVAAVLCVLDVVVDGQRASGSRRAGSSEAAGQRGRSGKQQAESGRTHLAMAAERPGRAGARSGVTRSGVPRVVAVRHGEIPSEPKMGHTFARPRRRLHPHLCLIRLGKAADTTATNDVLSTMLQASSAVH